MSTNTPISSKESHHAHETEIVTLRGTVTVISDAFGFILGEDEKTYIYPFSELKVGENGEIITTPISYFPQKQGEVVTFHLERRVLARTGLPKDKQNELAAQPLESVGLCW